MSVHLPTPKLPQQVRESERLGNLLPTALKDEEITAGFRDPSFSRNKQFPLHRWVPWVAGFSAHFVNDCIRNYLTVDGRRRGWVLDPFAGVGTTLVEAFLHGQNVIGFEINPYAVLAVTSKLEAPKVSQTALADYIADYEVFMDEHSSLEAAFLQPSSIRPEGFSGRTQLYSSSVERQVLFTLDFIKSIRNRRIRNLFKLGFGSVMVSFSNYTYEPSLTRRVSVDKPEIYQFDVKKAVATKLHSMLDDVVWVQDHMDEMEQAPQHIVVPNSIFTAPSALERRNFVDLVVTSPPYLNNYHYPRNTRPQIHWLDLSSKRGYEAANESLSFGKFWQSVRGLPTVSLTFVLPELQEIVDFVRSLNNHKAHYGGAGWANYIATYFNDTYRFCRLLRQFLRPNGVAVIVLGNSIIQGVEVKTDKFFGEIAALCGLSFEKTILLRNKRTGSSIIQSSVRVDKAQQKTVLYESAIVLRREK